jgi:hypothetical protein
MGIEIQKECQTALGTYTDPWRWEYSVPSRRRKPITKCCNVIFQKKRVIIHTAVRNSKPARFT